MEEVTYPTGRGPQLKMVPSWGSPKSQTGEGSWYLYDGLFVGVGQLTFLKNLQQILDLHPNSVGNKEPIAESC